MIQYSAVRSENRTKTTDQYGPCGGCRGTTDEEMIISLRRPPTVCLPATGLTSAAAADRLRPGRGLFSTERLLVSGSADSRNGAYRRRRTSGDRLVIISSRGGFAERRTTAQFSRRARTAAAERGERRRMIRFPAIDGTSSARLRGRLYHEAHRQSLGNDQEEPAGPK